MRLEALLPASDLQMERKELSGLIGLADRLRPRFERRLRRRNPLLGGGSEGGRSPPPSKRAPAPSCAGARISDERTTGQLTIPDSSTPRRRASPRRSRWRGRPFGPP